jgi:hypothetical protein
VSLFELREGPVELTDAGERGRETVTAEQGLVPAGAVRGGQVVFFGADDANQ